MPSSLPPLFFSLRPYFLHVLECKSLGTRSTCVYICIYTRRYIFPGKMLFYEPQALCQAARQKKASYSALEKLLLNWLQKPATKWLTLVWRMLNEQRVNNSKGQSLQGARLASLAIVREIWTRQRCQEGDGRPSQSSNKVCRFAFRKSFARSKINSVSKLSSFLQAFWTLGSCIIICTRGFSSVSCRLTNSLSSKYSIEISTCC